MTKRFPLSKPKPSWKPRRNGNAYCSPACGFGAPFCTWDGFQRATREAADLAARLGPGWEPSVWENIGWHYKARVPGEARFEVHGRRHYGQKRTAYMCFLGGPYASESHGTPEAAIHESMQMAAKDLAAIAALGKLAALHARLKVLPARTPPHPAARR